MSCHVPFPFFTVRTHVFRRCEGWVGWIDFSLLFFAYMHDWVCILKCCQDFRHVLSWSIYHIVSYNTWLGHNNRSLLIFTSGVVCKCGKRSNFFKLPLFFPFSLKPHGQKCHQMCHRNMEKDRNWFIILQLLLPISKFDLFSIPFSFKIVLFIYHTSVEDGK